MAVYTLCGLRALRGRGFYGEGEERRERRRGEKTWAGLKTQETHKWPQEVTHVRGRKDLRVTVVPCSCPRAESLNESGE